jgi:hypothetical protein
MAAFQIVLLPLVRFCVQDGQVVAGGYLAEVKRSSSANGTPAGRIIHAVLVARIATF